MPLFERFTDRARRVLVLAQDEARLCNHNFLGTEHLLLGLIEEGDGVAARALGSLGVSLEAARERVMSMVGPGGGAPTGAPPFTPRAKKVLEFSLREALQLNHSHIGTEHLLLGLIREGEGPGAMVLVELGADLSTAREQVMELMSDVPSGGERSTVFGEHRLSRELVHIAGLIAREEKEGPVLVYPEHYLLALLSQEGTRAWRVLRSLGVTAEAVESRLGEMDPETDDPPG